MINLDLYFAYCLIYAVSDTRCPLPHVLFMALVSNLLASWRFRLCAHPRWGPAGQGRLLCDIHSALIRVLEGLDEDLMEAPTMAGYGSAADLAPQDAFRPLLGASWPELARRYLQDHGPLTVSQDAVEAVLRLKVLCIPLVMPLSCHARSLSHVAH